MPLKSARRRAAPRGVTAAAAGTGLVSGTARAAAVLFSAGAGAARTAAGVAVTAAAAAVTAGLVATRGAVVTAAGASAAAASAAGFTIATAGAGADAAADTDCPGGSISPRSVTVSSISTCSVLRAEDAWPRSDQA